MTDSATEQTPIEVSGLYFNGFQIALTNADISGILLLNGQPQVVVNMSYTTAKSLAEGLTDVVKQLEAVTKRPIMTTKDVEKGLNDLVNKRGKVQ